MENRAFNIVSVFTLGILIFFIICDVLFNMWPMSLVLTCMLGVQCSLYYYSRVKKKFKAGIIIYAVFSYITLIINYYLDSGINGPTLFLFFLTFHLLITVSPRRQYGVWISIHIVVAIFLLISEYQHPSWVPNAYIKPWEHAADVISTYIITILFILFSTNYLRRYYNYEKKIAHERSIAISQQNEQLKHLDEEKNKLFSIISHDLKSPLDSILSYLELLSEETVDLTERIEIERELFSLTKSTSEMLLNLLSWSKAQMQGVTVRLTSLKLMDVIDAAASYKKALAAKKRIKITYSIAPDIEVVGDKNMLELVIRNVVNNAIKFTPSGGDIMIKAHRKNREAEITIHDNGVGIPLELQKDIFTMDAQSTYGTNNEKGIGLGLMLCKEFIEYQLGSIRFESIPGAGTTFYITLPLAKN